MSPDPARVGRGRQGPLLLDDLFIASIVVRALGDVLRVCAGAVNAGASAVTKDLAKWTPLFPWPPAYAEEELPAVQGMGVLGEGSLGRTFGADELLVLVNDDGVAGAVGDLADPEAAVGDLIVCQAGRALVPVRG